MYISNIPFLFSDQNQEVISRGLIGYWTFNEGSSSVIRDYNGGQNVTNGTILGSGLTWKPGIVGTALSGSGAGGVAIADSAYLRPGSAAWTIAYWFWAPDVAQAGRVLVGKRNNGPGFIQLTTGIGSINAGGVGVSGKQIFLFQNSPIISYNTTANVVDGNWHHVAVIRNTTIGTHQIYVDGVNKPLTALAAGGPANINNTDQWTILSDNGGVYANAAVDDVRLYNCALSQSEVTALYLMPKPLYFINSQVGTWIQNVAINGGGKPSQDTVNALDTFYTTLNSASLTSKIMSAICFVPDSLGAAITPLIINSGSTFWTSSAFLTADLSRDGLKGDGSTKRLDTSINPNTSWGSNNNGGISIYVSQDVSEAGCTIGASGAANQQDTMYTNFSGNSQFDSHYNNNTARISVGALGAGFYSGNRVTSNDMRLFWGTGSNNNLIQKGINTNAPGTRATSNLWLYCYNSAGNPIQFISKRLSFAAIHEGLDITQSSQLFQAVQTLRQTLGGGYI